MSLTEKRTVSTISFVCSLVLALTFAIIFLYNIVQWGNLPDYGYGYRTATGIGVIGALTDPGRRARLEVGDRMLRVNGKSFGNVREFRAARNKEIGDKNTYLVERGERQFEVTITNPPLRLTGAFKRSGLPYLVGICYMLIGTLVFLMKPHQRTSWIFFLFAVTFGLYLTFLVKLDELRPLWLGTLHIFLYSFIPATFIHMALSFPEERTLIKRHPYVQIVPYLASGLLFFCIRSTTSILADVPKIWSVFLMTYLVGGMFIFLGSCFQLWISSRSEIVKLRSKIILLGAAISASVPLLETVTNTLFQVFIVPSFNYYLPFFVVFPLFVGYSIVKHNLFDIDAIIKRTYGYILTTGAIAGIYGLVVLISNLAFARFEVTKSPLFPLVFILAIVFLFNPIRNRVQKFIDRVFYRLEYNYQETVQKISDSLRSLLSFEQIGGRMMETASHTMFMESGCVFVLKPEGKVYEFLTRIEKADELGKPIPSPLATSNLPANDPLIKKISETKKELTIYDIQEDPLFGQEREACIKSFGQLDASLIVPLVYEDSLTGLMSLGIKKSGKFYRREDINLLRILANQGAVAIENAKLHQAKIEALEHSKKELEQLNRAKSKALDHLSHELRTPLSVIQGNIRILKRKTQAQTPPVVREEVFDSLEKNLGRLSDIQQETDKIIRTYQEMEESPGLEVLGISPSAPVEPISLYPFIERLLKEVKEEASHRDIQITLEGEKDLTFDADPRILEEMFIGLLKNAIENTPDEGVIRVVLEQKAQWIQLKVMDFGIGITKENQRRLFDGLFHTLDTELYSSKKPYDFGAGGKGLDLLRMRVYSQRFGFDISVASQRCVYLPTDRDLCPGKISECPHCKTRKDCLNSGGSTFCLTFTVT